MKYYFIFNSLGIDISMQKALLITTISGFSSIVSITPGNLGVQEIFTSVAAAMLGQNIVDGVLVSIVDRLITMIITLIFGSFFMFAFKKEFAGLINDK